MRSIQKKEKKNDLDIRKNIRRRIGRSERTVTPKPGMKQSLNTHRDLFDVPHVVNPIMNS
jgi:hypothetical protein